MKTVNTTAHPDSQKLVPYTGFYKIGTGGAFLSIDTTINRTVSNSAPENAEITFSYSSDGKSTVTYTFDSGCSFDGGVLDVPGVINLTFLRGYSEGTLTTFTGKINGAQVSGSTPFNPVKIKNFVGKYYDFIDDIPFLALSITSENDIQFSYGTDKMHTVSTYSYNPAMYLLTFESIEPNAKKYILMLGTAGKLGLACSVQQGKSATYLISCLPKTKAKK
ncbi:MAG: hypothetical protein ACJASQ_002122 [Crocinitomicaceae bacterium]|jgi:hypothetical protein